jgi:hypothetical protein
MIISCSRRSDIPAAHSEWLMQRLEAGYCDVPNPMNLRQISRVSLCPEDVTLIVFWTKNPAPLIPYLPELAARGYRYYFLYTLNGYDRTIEPNVPELSEGIRTFQKLSELIGPEKVIWRYDPIIISSNTDAAYHAEKFSFIARELHGFTRRAIISLVDFYKKRDADFHELDLKGYQIERNLDQSTILSALVPCLVDAAQLASMEIQSCAEPIDLSSYGVMPGKCIDDVFIERVFGIHVFPIKDGVQRSFCGCIKSRDIGRYNTCSLGCRYCYANS